MVEEIKKDETPVAPETPKTVTVPVQGDPGHVELDTVSEIAILVTLDTRSGEVQVANVLNCPFSAYARMLLNEAIRLYEMKGIAGLTVATAERRMAELGKEKKGGLVNPFKKG